MVYRKLTNGAVGVYDYRRDTGGLTLLGQTPRPAEIADVKAALALAVIPRRGEIGSQRRRAAAVQATLNAVPIA